MRRLFPAIARFVPILIAAACISPTRTFAGPVGTLLEERYHAALSEFTQQVRQAPDPAEKRRILARFLDHMEDGLGKAENLSELSPADKQSLHTILGKYLAYEAELEGTGGFMAVADSDLNEFANYIRQDMEQAPVGGGIYISAGALLVILIILILLF